MHKVTNEEVDYILNDIESRGIVLDVLRDDLLDHMCCIIESEMCENDNFYQFYESVLPRFFNEDLAEIQTETDNLLRFKNFYSMIRTMKITGLLTVVFTIIGAAFKTLHLPGAGIMILLGGFIFSFIFLPLLIALKLRDEESKTDKYVFSFGFLLAIILAVGLIFKLMHWPYATILMLSGTVAFTFVYVPLYFFTRIRRAEVRLNTIVNSVLMMACGGIFFSLFNLKNSKSFEDYLTENHYYMNESSERLFESNQKLMSRTPGDSSMISLHRATMDVNNAVEKVASKIADNKGADIDQLNAELIKSIDAYNDLIRTSANETSNQIKTDDLHILHKLSIETCLNVLARIQQELAINENRYLVMK